MRIDKEEKQIATLEQLVNVLQDLKKIQKESQIHALQGVNNAYTFERYETTHEELGKNVVIVKDRREREYAIVLIDKHYQSKEAEEFKNLKEDMNAQATANIVKEYLENCAKKRIYTSVIISQHENNLDKELDHYELYKGDWELRQDIKKNPGRWKYLNDAIIESSISIGNNEKMLQMIDTEGKIHHYLIKTFLDKEGDERDNIGEIKKIKLASEKSPSELYSPIGRGKGQILVDFDKPEKKGLIAPLYSEWGTGLINRIGPQFNIQREDK